MYARECMGLSGSSGRLYVSKAQRARNILVRLEIVTITELTSIGMSGDSHIIIYMIVL